MLPQTMGVGQVFLLLFLFKHFKKNQKESSMTKFSLMVQYCTVDIVLYFVFLLTHLQTGMFHHCPVSFTLSHSATIQKEGKACIVLFYHYFITLISQTAQPPADMSPAMV